MQNIHYSSSKLELPIKITMKVRSYTLHSLSKKLKKHLDPLSYICSNNRICWHIFLNLWTSMDFRAFLHIIFAMDMCELYFAALKWFSTLNHTYNRKPFSAMTHTFTFIDRNQRTIQLLQTYSKWNCKLKPNKKHADGTISRERKRIEWKMQTRIS